MYFYAYKLISESLVSINQFSVNGVAPEGVQAKLNLSLSMVFDSSFIRMASNFVQDSYAFNYNEFLLYGVAPDTLQTKLKSRGIMGECPHLHISQNRLSFYENHAEFVIFCCWHIFPIFEYPHFSEARSIPASDQIKLYLD